MQRALYLVALLGLLLGYYTFLGPGPSPSELVEDLEWWRPSGLVHTAEVFAPLQTLAEGEFPGKLVPVAIFWIPALAMLVWGFRLFRSAVLRTLSTTAFFVLLIFPYYGYVADRVWRFFEWRSPAVAAGFAVVMALSLFAPSLLRAALGRSRAFALIALALAFAGTFLLTTEVTGTDAWMRFNISPWPVVTLFGLLLLGSALACFHVAAGAGAWVASRLPGSRGLLTGALVAGVAGVATAQFALQGPPPRTLVWIAIIAVGYALARIRLAPADAAEAARSAAITMAAGVFALFAIHASNSAAASYQRTARNETATELLVALNDYREKTGSFPKRLDDLVPEFFSEVPRPRIGLIVQEDDEFTYRNLGDSYVLEFSSVQWVQCGYSPPFDVAKYSEEDYEDEELDPDEEAYEDEELEEEPVDPELQLALDDAGLEGSWNCEDAPPKLW